jgi:hypothetical protein
MGHTPRAFVSLVVVNVVLVAASATPGVAFADSSSANRIDSRPTGTRDVLVVLPVGNEQRHMFELLTELRRGLAAGAAASTQPRYRETAAVDQLTGDKKLVSQLQRAGLHYGMSKDEEHALVTRVRLPRKVGNLGGVLQASLSISESGMQMDLELYELGPAGLELKLRKSIRGSNLDEMRVRVASAGRVLAVQEDQGGRPEYAFKVAPGATVRRGHEVVLDIGDTADPELDAFDWAWCQVAGPTPVRTDFTAGRWRRGERQVRFSPDTEGQYTFLLWAGEVLRDEREPNCEEGSAHVAAIPVHVEPYALTLQGMGAWDAFASGVDRGSAGAARLGLHWRLFDAVGVRGMVDLLERMGAIESRPVGKNAYFAAASAGPSYDVRLGHDLVVRPFASLFWRLPPDGDPGELGWGLGTDLVLGLSGPWAAVASVESLSASYTRLRAGVGVAYRR